MQYTKVRDVKDIEGLRQENAGFDFFVPNDWNNGKPYILRIGEQINIPSGIKIKLNSDQMMKVDNKSGVALKRGILVGATIIDAGYRGELKVILLNTGSEKFEIHKGDRIAQLVFQRCELPVFSEADTLPESIRGNGGFGSTGKN